MKDENEFTFGGKRYVAKLGHCEKCAFFRLSLRAGEIRCTLPKCAPPCVDADRADGRDVIFVPAGTRKTAPKTRQSKKRGQVAVKSPTRANRAHPARERASRQVVGK